jgi:APA family basic amino acid/polyamine antiporter
MASAGALPEAFTRLGAKTRAPYIAIGVSAVVAAVFVLLRDLTLVASVTDLAIYLVFIAVDLAVVILRFRLPDHPRPFRAPGAIGRVPVIPVLGLLAVLIMLPALRWEALALGAGLCAIGLGVYGLLPHPARPPYAEGAGTNATFADSQ